MATVDPRALVPVIESLEDGLRRLQISASLAEEDSARLQRAIEDVAIGAQNRASYAFDLATAAMTAAEDAVSQAGLARSEAEHAYRSVTYALQSARGALGEAQAMESHWSTQTGSAESDLARAKQILTDAVNELERLLAVYRAAVDAESAACGAYSACTARQYTDNEGKRQGPSCTWEARALTNAQAERIRAEQPLPGAKAAVSNAEGVVHRCAARLELCRQRLAETRLMVDASYDAVSLATSACDGARDSARLAGETETAAYAAREVATTAVSDATRALSEAQNAAAETASARAATAACGRDIDNAHALVRAARNSLGDRIEQLVQFDRPDIRL